MKSLRLGLPEIVSSGLLARRLAWLTGLRLVFLSLALTLVALFYIHDGPTVGSFSLKLTLATLAVSFALAAVYAAVLRSGRAFERLADVQLVLDQLTWTAVAYLTGGASSGATSFYGLSCLVGAGLTGMRGAGVAGVSGWAFYGALVIALQRGWLRPPPDQHASLYALSWDEASFYLLVNFLVLVVVSLLAGTLAERLRWTGGELVLATERADKAESMAALGRLAAGLAHEIRNPLGSIAGSIQLLRTAEGLGDEDRRLCDIVQREANRLNDLVTDMMDLSKPRKPTLAPVDVAALAREVVELAAKSGRSASDVHVTYEGLDSATLQGDGAQLKQLVWNLVRNAVQASSAGEVVRVEVVCGSHGSLELRVVDRGVGIDVLGQRRLFDAFFTTRSQGTGVGLAVVKRIADEHGFAITVESGEGRGAVFCVELGRRGETPGRAGVARS